MDCLAGICICDFCCANFIIQADTSWRAGSDKNKNNRLKCFI